MTIRRLRSFLDIKKENITVIRIMMITHTNSFHNQGITTTHIMKMRKVIEIL